MASRSECRRFLDSDRRRLQTSVRRADDKCRNIPFNEVSEDYARWRGEGDRSLESWRRMYWSYIVQECKRIGREPATIAPIIMARFLVVYHQPLQRSIDEEHEPTSG